MVTIINIFANSVNYEQAILKAKEDEH
jgi:hypothetical protein